MTSCAPDEDIEGRFYGIGPEVPFKGKKKFSKRHTPKDKTPPHTSALEDHMEGSPYKREDICPQCGLRRDSTVYCTMSHLHHGNDMPLSPSHGHDGTSPSSKHKKKDRKTPKQHSRSPMNADDNSPHKGSSEYLHGATFSIGDAMITVSAASSPAHGAADSPAHVVADDETVAHHEEADEAAAVGEEGATQYYCYTDEKGDTYYYAEEMKDTVPNSKNHAAAEAPTAAAAPDAERQPQVYVYTYEDENGVQQTVMVQGAPETEEGDEDDEDDENEDEDEDKIPSDVARDGGSQQEDANNQKNTDKKKKKKRTFASTISSLFQRRTRRASRTDDNEEVDGDNSGLLPAHDAQLLHRDPASGLSPRTNVDEAVAATVESLEPSERKKFEKERRRLVKELEEHEKTHRSKLIKDRRQYVDDLVKERRACMTNLREDDPK